MANVMREATPGDEWQFGELSAYNITFVNRTKEEFFGTHQLPLPTQPSLAGFMTAYARHNAQDDETRKLLHYLDIALSPDFGQGAAVIIFLAKLLEKLGYDDGSRMVFIRHELPFLICRELSVARTAICVLDDDDEVVLLVQGERDVIFRDAVDDEDNLVNQRESEPPAIAAAIAAYDASNEIRRRRYLDPLPHITFPAIAMTETSPVFYKITVTEELSTAVHTGSYPTTQTIVEKFAPTLPHGPLMAMRSLENRREILSCLYAFKQFMRIPQ